MDGKSIRRKAIVKKSYSAEARRSHRVAVIRLAEGDKAKPPMPTKTPAGMESARAAAFVDLCQMLFASNEFLYIN